MAAGDLTVSVVGQYATLALAVAAMNTGNDALVTDFHKLIWTGGTSFAVIKYVRATA